MVTCNTTFCFIVTISLNSSFFLCFSIRLAPGTSLFDTVPFHLSEPSPPKYCTCQTEFRFAGSRAQTPWTPSPDSSCFRQPIVHHLTIIPALDVTAEYIRSVELHRGDEVQFFPPGRSNPKPQVGDTNEDRFQLSRAGDPLSGSVVSTQPQQHRSRRQGHQYIPNSQHQSLSQSDLEGFSYFFPEDHEPAAQPDTPPTWPTPSGFTEHQVRTQCLKAVAESNIAVSCRRLLDKSIMGKVVMMCVSDLQLKDDESWLNATLPLLENECERRLVEDKTREVEHHDILAALKCPGLCNGNGQCSEWGCVCFPGFGSYDCSVMSGKLS